MTRPIRLNGELYRLLLFAYPRDFRLRFGTEMVITFSEQIRAEREHDGLVGVMRVWRTGIDETDRERAGNIKGRIARFAERQGAWWDHP